MLVQQITFIHCLDLALDEEQDYTPTEMPVNSTEQSKNNFGSKSLVHKKQKKKIKHTEQRVYETSQVIQKRRMSQFGRQSHMVEK